MKCNSLIVLFFLIASCQHTENSIRKIEKSSDSTSVMYYNSFVDSNKFILDSISLDLNDDHIIDLIIVIDDLDKNIENTQHMSPLPILIFKGTNTGYALWMSNDMIVENLGDNCSAEGFQRIVRDSNTFTIISSVCKDHYYVKQSTTFCYDIKTRDVLLKRLSLYKTNREKPDEEIPEQLFTSYDFGEVSFQDFDIDNIEKQIGF